MTCVTRWYLYTLTFAIALCQMRHDGVMIINCSDFPIYANMTYTVLGVEHSVKSCLMPKFNKLTTIKYPPACDNCTVNVQFYMQPKGKGDFRFRGQVDVDAHRGECFYVNPPQLVNFYRLCELEKIFTGRRACPDLWYLDDNFMKKTLPPATASTKIGTRAARKTTKDGGPAGKQGTPATEAKPKAKPKKKAKR